jgi:hypothetical protein
MNKIKVENIVAFQSIEEFEEATGAEYSGLSDQELFEILAQWHFPGEHESNFFNEEDINTPFLGRLYKNEYLLSRYEHGLVIGLSFIVKKEGV